MKHFDVLSMVLVLLIGAWAIFYFQYKSRRFPDSELYHFLRYIILFNAMELVIFFYVYFDINLTTPQWRSFSPWLKGIDWPLRSLLILGIYISQYKMIAWLRGKKLSKWILPALFLFMAVLMIGFLLAMRFPAYMPKNPYFNFWNLYIWPLKLLEMTWLVRLLFENRHGVDPDRRRSNRAYAWFFLFRIPVQIILILPGMAQSYFWNITLSKLMILYTNLIPIFWLKYYYTPWAGALSKIIDAGNRLDSLQQTHGLSARELEILRLILDGKSYKQMEDMLFISIHTVKSHVYNLYRKLGVKNHRQLTHFLATRQQENS